MLMKFTSEKQETKSGRPAPDDDDLDDDAEAFDDDYFEDTVDETTSTADGDIFLLILK